MLTPTSSLAPWLRVFVARQVRSTCLDGERTATTIIGCGPAPTVGTTYSLQACSSENPQWHARPCSLARESTSWDGNGLAVLRVSRSFGYEGGVDDDGGSKESLFSPILRGRAGASSGLFLRSQWRCPSGSSRSELRWSQHGDGPPRRLDLWRWCLELGGGNWIHRGGTRVSRGFGTTRRGSKRRQSVPRCVRIRL
jgi:hypothetical protein